MRVAALEGHRIWSETYDEAPNPLLALEERVLAPWLEPWTGRRLVDVGCGTGRWMAHAQPCGARVAGVDLCHEMLLRAASKSRLTGHLARGSAECLPLASATADLVVCSFALGYVADARAAIREMARICDRGGRVVVSDLHPEALEAGWKRAFRSGDAAFEIEHFPHPTPVLLEAASGAGLRLERTAAACFGDPERAIFSRAGKERVFDEASRLPAVWIAAWIKP